MKSSAIIFSIDGLRDFQIIVCEFLTSIASRVHANWQLEQVSVRR